MVSLGLGIVAFFRSIRLAHPGEEICWLHLEASGFGLSVLGLFAMALAGTANHRDLQSLGRGEPPRLRKWTLSLTLALLMRLLGLVGLGAMVTLWVWLASARFGRGCGSVSDLCTGTRNPAPEGPLDDLAGIGQAAPEQEYRQSADFR
jgi:hypothetical protein